MKLYSVLVCIGLLLGLMLSCTRSTKVELSGEFPIEGAYYISLYDFVSGKLVSTDTVETKSFKFALDSLQAGLYQLVFSWERNVLRPQELQRFARFNTLDPPKYYLSTTCWIDPKEANDYQVKYTGDWSQFDMEEIMISNKVGEEPYLTSTGKNTTLYNEYLALMRRFRLQNQHVKDKLRTELYAANDEGDLEKSNAINKRLVGIWDTDIKNACLQEEIAFLKAHIESLVVPYIFLGLIKNKEDLKTYKAVYTSFASKDKKVLDRYLSRILKSSKIN